MQVTTSGDIMGQINQIFPMSSGEDNQIVSFLFDGTGTFGPIGSSGMWRAVHGRRRQLRPAAEFDDGSCEDMVWGCIDERPATTTTQPTDNGTCQYVDECGECGGQGVPMGRVTARATSLTPSACGRRLRHRHGWRRRVRRRGRLQGELDACGICNGPGAVFDCGCDLAPAGACDCNGNMLDALGVCGGDWPPTWTAMACATTRRLRGLRGRMRRVQRPRRHVRVWMQHVPAGDCDCEGNQLDAVGVCGGDCTEDANGNGIYRRGRAGGLHGPACNYDAAATENDGSCDFCSCEEPSMA